MGTVDVLHVSKAFGSVKAVNDVTFEVGKGDIFGMLGPNGAGKTTTIRLILDIFKPDAGQVAILGGPMTEAKKDRVGYMPEERGLYQDIPLERVLTYLASLKSVPPADARLRIQEYLERFDLAAHKTKKIKELSKGMQQKAQVIATLLHQPELLIIDEPFSGLDPLNTQMVKELLLDLHRQGVTIIMSSHQMHQVEEMCDRILLIDHGQVVLYGELDEIRRQYAGNAVLVHASGELPHVPGMLEIQPENSGYKISLARDVTPQDLLRALVMQNVPLTGFELAAPTLDEIFIQVVQGRAGEPQ